MSSKKHESYMLSSTRAIQVLLHCCDVCSTYSEDKGRTWGHLLIHKLFKNCFSFIKESIDLSSYYAQKEGQSGTEETEKSSWTGLSCQASLPGLKSTF